MGGTPAAAIPPARTATAIWVDLDAPYDVASARLVLGAAHAAMADVDLARLEWQAAGAAYAAFGAHRMLTRVKALIDGPAIGSAQRGHVAALSLDGDRWHLVHGGRSVTVPDLKGVRLLARLLAEPGREFPALDLAGAGVVEPGMPVLDDEAKACYRRRLAEVEEDLAEAERNHDEARRQLAERDRGYLLAELSGAVVSPAESGPRAAPSNGRTPA